MAYTNIAKLSNIDRSIFKNQINNHREKGYHKKIFDKWGM